MVIWFILQPFCYILPLFGIFLPVLVFCAKKNLATLLSQPTCPKASGIKMI
jgi:hypothetical protein